MSQRMKALTLANEVRLARTDIGREVRNGERSIESVILDPPAVLHRNHGYTQTGTTILEVLCWQHRWQTTRARKLLNKLEISGQKRPCDLGEETRKRLVRALRDPRDIEPPPRVKRPPGPTIPREVGDELHKALRFMLRIPGAEHCDPVAVLGQYEREVEKV